MQPGLNRLEIVLAVSVLVAGVPARLAAREYTLVANGRPDCAVVLMPGASASARFACEELVAYVRTISGATLPTTAAPGRTRIVIAALREAAGIPETVTQRLNACASDEAFYIKTDSDAVFIIGKTPIGALYGTYSLLEDYLGVRWFFPGELGEYCPRTETVTLPDIDEVREPAMATRLPALHTASYNFHDAVIWCARQKMQNRARPALRWFKGCTEERADFLNEALNAHSSRGGHLLFEQAVPDSLFDEHPGYFTLRDGKRTFGGRLQRCLADPDVLDRVVEYGLNWCSATPANVLHICSHDSRETWCQCAECRKLGTVDGTFKITNLYHRFFSKVVGAIVESNPDARIDVYFYIDYGVAPDDRSIRYSGKNVRGIYCTCFPHSRCYAHPFTDPGCPLNAKCLADLKDVLQICPQLYTYEYVPSADIRYAPIQQTVARDIKDLAALGVEGYMDVTVPVNATIIDRLLERSPDAPYYWLARWPSLYLGAKLQWDTRLDPDAVMADAYGKYYGTAAPAMTTYHALRLELWQNAPGHAFYGGPARAAHCLTVPGAQEELNACLAEAEKAAADDARVLERVAMDRDFLTRFWQAKATELQKRFSAEKKIIPQRVRDKVTIDGDLSESAWLSARPVSGFLKLNTTQPAAADSNFRVAYDDDNLYVGFVAMNDKAWAPAVARMTERDSQEIWRDDHIEIEFAPPGSGGYFYHLCVNTNGVFYDSVMVGMNIDRSHDSQAEIKVKRLADRFVYELRLPLKPMNGEVSPGKVWGMYAMRSAKNLQPPDTAETSSLDGNTPHHVHEFRRVVFGENVVRNGNLAETRAKKNGTGE